MTKKSMSALAKERNIEINEISSKKARARGAFGLAADFVAEMASVTVDIWGLNLNDNDAEAFSKGKLIIDLEPDRLIDSIGSDRIGNWEEDVDFQSLKMNIMERGQLQPVIVSFDYDKKQFELQSGRRRLYVCKSLNMKVKVKLNTNKESSTLERYYENNVRKNLSFFENLVSIHELNLEYGSNFQGQMSYEEMVMKFNVPSKSYFSLAKYVYENKKALLEERRHDKWTKQLITKKMSESKSVTKKETKNREIIFESGKANITETTKSVKVTLDFSEKKILDDIEKLLLKYV